MRLLIDENVHEVVVRGLRVAGYETLDVKRSSRQGVSDRHLIEYAVKERCVIVTHDRDFLREPKLGVLLIRLRKPKPAAVLERLVAVLAQAKYRTALKHRATVIVTDRGTEVLNIREKKS